MAKEKRPNSITLIRHAESVWNDFGVEEKKKGNVPTVMQGVPDHKTPITKKGVQQAQITGKALHKEFGKFDILYHSPYTRTTQTADIIANELPYGIEIYRDMFLVEQQFAFLDAGTYSDKEKFMEYQETFNNMRDIVGKWYARPLNGESWFDVSVRTYHFLGKLFREKLAGKDILVVSHAVTIATFLYHLQGRDEEECVRYYQENKLDNCGVTRFEYNPKDRWNWAKTHWNSKYY